MKGVWKENVWVWNQKHMYVKGEYVWEYQNELWLEWPLIKNGVFFYSITKTCLPQNIFIYSNM